MSQAREIVNQIRSIQNTQKITRAMELVAASKVRKAQERMKKSKPYAEKIRQIIRHVAAATSEFRHPYLQHAEDRVVANRCGYIVVTSDRGLCGGLNINLLRKLLPDFQAQQANNVDIDLCLIGRKGEAFFSRVGGNVLAVASQLGDTPNLQELVGLVKVMLDLFDQGKLDAVYIASNEFVNTMRQKPVVRQLLPLPQEEEAQTAQTYLSGHWDYIYEPDDARTLLTMLLVRYIESQVYQAVIENIACFQAAQMVAMKSATDNAGELIKELKLVYNKARQAGITREIAEIIGGAAAVDEG